MNFHIKLKLVTWLMSGLLIFSIPVRGQGGGYVIKGKIKGLEKGMVLALGDIEKFSELARVTPKKNGAFKFEGKVEEVVYAIIRVYKEDKMVANHTAVFYLENEAYELNANFEDLQYATFSGTSEANEVANILHSRKLANEQKIDSLNLLIENIPMVTVKKTVKVNGSLREVEMLVPDSTKIIADQDKKWEQEVSDLYKENRKIEWEFVDEYTDSYPVLAILNRYAAANKRRFDMGDEPGPNMVSDEVLADYYEEFSRKLRTTTLGKAYYSNLYERIAIKEGDKYYEFEDVITLDNEPFKVTNVDNEYVLLAFTSVGCSGCQKFNAAMIPQYHKIKDKVEIVAYYTTADITRVREHTKKKNIKWKVVSDYKGEHSPIKHRYQIHAIPQFFLLNKDRKIVKYQGGYSQEFVDYLVELGSS